MTSQDYTASPAMFRNHPFGFVGAVLLIPVFGLGILILLYWYVQVRSVRLTISGDSIQLARGIFNKEQTDIDVREIRTVTIRQSFWQRIFDVGQIEVFTTGDLPEITLQGIPDPNFVRNYIRDRMNSDETKP